MKKILLGALGLALLSSCNVTVTDSGNGNSAVIYGNTLNLTSNYTVENMPFQGSTYSGPVICDDRTTNLRFDFNYFGPLQKANLKLQGITTGQQTNLQVTDYRFSGGKGSVQFVASAGTVPLSLDVKPQSIVVSPLVSGATKVLLQGVDTSGGVTSYVSSNALPVLSNCN